MTMGSLILACPQIKFIFHTYKFYFTLLWKYYSLFYESCLQLVWREILVENQCSNRYSMDCEILHQK